MLNVYLRFLSLVEVLDCSICIHPKLDETSKKLLEVIAAKHNQNIPMSVSEAMTIKKLAKPATIHRKLRKLIDSGLIEHIFQGKNRRTKYLVPTNVANEYFSHLGSLMEQAIQSPHSSRS